MYKLDRVLCDCKIGRGWAADCVPVNGFRFTLEFVPVHKANVEQLLGEFICIPNMFTLLEGVNFI